MNAFQAFSFGYSLRRIRLTLPVSFMLDSQIARLVSPSMPARIIVGKSAGKTTSRWRRACCSRLPASRAGKRGQNLNVASETTNFWLESTG
jgi:hypothetical protein